MSDPRRALLSLLADGAEHAGPALGAALGCTRAAVWKQVAALRAMGLAVETRGRQGYCIPGGVELLDAGRIGAALGPPARQALVALEVAFSIDSTSGYLLGQSMPGFGEVACCLAEYQDGGRGRRGRRWLSPVARGLCLSLGVRLERGGHELPTLSLVAGVAVVRALEVAGAGGVLLKWPNDVILGGGKLGGILVDVAGEPGGPLHVVIGVGINVHGAPAAGDLTLAGGLPPASLAHEPGGRAPSRNVLAAALIDSLVAAVAEFDACGFAPFVDAWRHADFLAGRAIDLEASGRHESGVARGIADDGTLLIESGGGRRRVVAGEVTLRPRS
ncbi:MAG: biotin--[acetyl-CoA-carboxylase] ligase [Chromatiales bacterium]|jgi:BirA family biotin operon repressor/biotin-[acetyl-CoA-carboxylase] ligase|nr:biotin--[acetyl-CoA-carboxylase] ligase [Chromatiales bacterium]